MATLIIADLLDALVAAVDKARIDSAGNRRWLNAIETGYGWLLEQDVITFDLAHHELTVTSPTSGRTYHANGACQCEAFAQHNACWHRAASRLVRRALEGRPVGPQHPRPVKGAAAYHEALADLMECWA